jgi:elongation of very long chain fatty acids protein 6
MPEPELDMLQQAQARHLVYYSPVYVLALLAYVPAAVYARHRMVDRRPMPVKSYMVVWNGGLSLFSVLSFKYVALPLAGSPFFLTTAGICGVPAVVCPTVACMRWTGLFAWSKFPEMVDTVWVILRKRELALLHVWHHLSVAAYCLGQITAVVQGAGAHSLYFASMNAFVHALMYAYYAVVSGTSFRSTVVARCITALQIVQMVLGLAMHLFRTCACETGSSVEMWFGYLMYGSYLFLFANYYRKRYLSAVPAIVPRRKTE